MGCSITGRYSVCPEPGTVVYLEVPNGDGSSEYLKATVTGKTDDGEAILDAKRLRFKGGTIAPARMLVTKGRAMLARDAEKARKKRKA